MECRLATMDDLPRLKAMYYAIIDRMEQDGLNIWDAVYPCEYFAEDIQHGRLYVCLEQGELAAGFALCQTNGGQSAVTWQQPGATALYLDRLGVNVQYGRRGVGSAALALAMALARAGNVQYLRLFVVDSNVPAIKFYQKNCFQMAQGHYDEVIDQDLVLREYGFEVPVAQVKS